MKKPITINTFINDLKRNSFPISVFAILTTSYIAFFLIFLFDYKYSSSASIVSTGIDYNSSSVNTSSPLNLFSGGLSGDEMNIFTSNEILDEIVQSNQVVTSIITKEYTLNNGKKIIMLESFYDKEELEDDYSYYLNKSIKRFKGDNLSITSGLRSNLITLNVETHYPELSLLILNDLINNTKEQLVQLRNKNGEKKTNYLKKRIEEVKIDLSNSRDKEVKFLQDNKDLSTPSIKRRHDELMLDVSILANTYSVLTAEFELNKSKILSNKEVIEFANQPIISTIPTNSMGKFIMFLIFINICFAVFTVFAREVLNQIRN
tara:strand:+ start:32 stop:988 length:957 start_codon:yes stop_codon:yes gene_type:complete